MARNNKDYSSTGDPDFELAAQRADDDARRRQQDEDDRRQLQAQRDAEAARHARGGN